VAEQSAAPAAREAKKGSDHEHAGEHLAQEGERYVVEQPTKQVPRIGVLSPQPSTEPPTVQREPFARGLHALGWTPGVDILIEYRYAEGDVDRLPALAAELVQLPVDVIVARGNTAIRAAQQATATIPIVMAVSSDPVAQGFIANLGQPRRNMTGLSSMGADLSGKQLEIIKETVPMVSRIAVLTNPDNAGSPYLLQDVQVAAHALQVQLYVLAVQSREDLERAFAAIQLAVLGSGLPPRLMNGGVTGNHVERRLPWEIAMPRSPRP
jgi:putative ABC transport system substrate-binding protein